MAKGVIILSLRNVSIRKVTTTGASLSIILPPQWAQKGEHVCVAVKDADTLIISKKLRGAN